MFAIPVSEAQLWLFQALALIFVALVVRAMMRRQDETGALHDARSRLGIAVQAIGIGLAGVGPVKAVLPWSSVPAIAGLTAVLLLMGGVIALFASSTSALGRNWSIKARMRSDHELVRTGPYAHLRHPIYLAMLMFLFALTIALGHWFQLIVALPLFLIGTKVRTATEDQLLEARFGKDFVAYRDSTPSLIPRLF